MTTPILFLWARAVQASNERARADLTSAILALAAADASASASASASAGAGAPSVSWRARQGGMSVVQLRDAGGLVLAELHPVHHGYVVRAVTRAVAYQVAQVARAAARARRRERGAAYEAALAATARAIVAGAPWRALNRRDGPRGGTLELVGGAAVSYRGAMTRAAKISAGPRGVQRGLRARRPGESSRSLISESAAGCQ